MSESISFRFLAGSNLGAVFSLSAGEYTLGNSSECDIELDEQGAESIVVIRVDATKTVTVRLQSGRARLNGQELSAEYQPFPAGAILAIGFSAITYLTAGQSLESIDLSALGLAGKKNEEQQPHADVAQAVSRPEAATSTEIKAKPPLPDDKPAKPTSGLFGLPRAFVTVIGLVLLFLALISLIAGSALFGQRAQEREAVAAAQAYLKDNGFLKITPTLTDEVMVFKGEVPSTDDFTRFASNLPKLPFAAVLEVQVRDKLLHDIEKTCAVHGATVRAEYLNNNKGSIVLYGYVKDPYVKAQLIAAVQQELHLANLDAHFTDYGQMKDLIAKYQPQDFKVPLQLDSLKIYYEGKLTLEDVTNLEQLKADLAGAIKAPLALEPLKNRDRSQIELYRFTNSDLNLATTQEKSDNNSQGADAEILEPTQSFKMQDIVGVTMEPMRFVSMADGSRYFEGSVMPDGSVLREISVHQLTLERNGEKFIHELK